MMVDTTGLGRFAKGMEPRQRHMRAAGLLLACGLLVASVAACGAPDAADADATFFAQQTLVAGSRPSPQASPTVMPTEPAIPTPTLPPPIVTPTAEVTAASGTETPAATATAEAPDLPVRVNGSGTDVSEAVTLEAGVLLAQITHTGTGTFAVTLLNAAGESVVELADSTGPWVGSRAVVLPETGEYVAEVTADGDWQIELDARDPATSIISELPFEQTGAGSQAVYFVRVAPGERTLAAVHDGLTGFSVTVISSDGSFVDEVMASSGVVDTVETFTVPALAEGDTDTFLLVDIRASGNWTIRIE